ncbi:MAG: hypothetical protein WDN46_14815 [Methylocella sp.]
MPQRQIESQKKKAIGNFGLIEIVDEKTTFSGEGRPSHQIGRAHEKGEEQLLTSCLNMEQSGACEKTYKGQKSAEREKQQKSPVDA